MRIFLVNHPLTNGVITDDRWEVQPDGSAQLQQEDEIFPDYITADEFFLSYDKAAAFVLIAIITEVDRLRDLYSCVSTGFE